MQKVQAFADAIGAMRRLPRHARRGGARPRARRVRQPARCPARGAPARARRGLERRLRPAARARATASCPASCRAGWCCRRARRARRRCSTLTFDSQAALADDPNAAAVRDVTLSLRRAADRPRRASLSRPGRRARRRWPSAWTRPSSTTTASRSARDGFDAIGAELGAALRHARGARPGGRLGAGAAPVQLTPRRGRAASPGIDWRAAARRRPQRAADAARAAAPPRAPLLRARRAGDSRRRVRQAVPGAAGDRGRASRTADARFADPARDRRRARGLRAGAPRRADAVDPHRDRHRRAAGAEKLRRARAARSSAWPKTSRRSTTSPS